MRKIKGSPQPFGVDIKGKNINFAVQVAKGKTCELLLYKRGKDVPEYQFDMPEEEGVGEVRFLSVEGLKADRYEYNFLIDGKVCVDPYVKELAGKEKFGVERKLQEHQIRGKIVSMEDYDWQEDQRLHLPWEDVVAYGLHVRGFTKHSSSKVVHKGTFQGVVEKLDYLKELGVNQIQCMPVYEFEECGKTKVNYWGYGKGFYFAPKKAYAYGKSAVRELKDMVRACHSQGIEVVLEMPFVPGISANYVTECLRFYMLEYHVDGFVLNPYNVPWEQLIEDPFLKDIKLMQKDDGFQNVMRRFLKGDENMVNDVIWALKNRSSENGKCNYITTQTGFTLWDLVSYDCKHNEENGEKNLDGPDYNYSWNCGAEGPSRKRAVVNLRKNQVKNALELLLWIIVRDEQGKEYVILSLRNPKRVAEVGGILGYSSSGSYDRADNSPARAMAREIEEEIGIPEPGKEELRLISLGVDTERYLIQCSYLLETQYTIDIVKSARKGETKSGGEQTNFFVPLDGDILKEFLRHCSFEPGAAYSLMRLIQKRGEW